MSIHPKRVIWKFPIRLDQTSTFCNIPLGGVVVHVDNDPRLLKDSTDLAVWCQVDPDAPLEEREFRPFATGDEIPPYWYYQGTVLRNSGLVWHVHERIWE